MKTAIATLVLGLLVAVNGHAADTGSAAHGQILFNTLGCTACHGAQGEGGNARPGVPAPKLAGITLGLSDFIRQIRRPRGAMPAFPAAFASDRDLSDLYAYLTSVGGKPAALPMSAAPLAPSGSAARGKLLFIKVGCYECHDYAGEGSVFTGPSLSPNPLPYPAFAAQVRLPRQYMPKYPVKYLSEQQLADIYAYVRSLPPPPALKNLPLLTNR
ncbi:MAG TPA: c-type cytochrome [Candidatus Binataceae bacterium]|nr:c-type cytochrome [Candidatus Binataceae bacterium]